MEMIEIQIDKIKTSCTSPENVVNAPVFLNKKMCY